MKNGMITLRRLKDNKSDYLLLEKWYKEELVYTNFEQRILSYYEIVKKYLPRTKEDTDIPVYMIEYDNKPIGIIQFKLINEEDKKLYEIYDNNSYEMDIFIGEVNLHNKGIGSASINLISDYLFKKKNAKILVMCPLIVNEKAIRCYNKCGFKFKKNFKTEDTIGNTQEYVLMIKEK